MVTKVDRTDLLVAILNELGDALSKIENFRNEYREKCVTIGKTVQVTLPNGDIIEDLAIGISDSGALLLNSREITVGDIVHLR
jgi:BirA family biotin operon repressor/biotin-[acetyl-CoA-carboxylase] ligase